MDGTAISSTLNVENGALICVYTNNNSPVQFVKDRLIIKTINSNNIYKYGEWNTVAGYDVHLYYCIYYVHNSNFGTWTIYNNNLQRTITINDAHVYNVYFIEPIYINGLFYNRLTGGFCAVARKLRSNTASAKAPSITQYSDRFYYSLKNGGGTYQSVNKIDITPYSTFYCVYSNGYNGGIRFAVETGGGTGSNSYWDTTCPAYTHLVAGDAPTIQANIVDVSNVNTNCVILFGSSWASGTINGNIYAVWFEY